MANDFTNTLIVTGQDEPMGLFIDKYGDADFPQAYLPDRSSWGVKYIDSTTRLFDDEYMQIIQFHSGGFDAQDIIDELANQFPELGFSLHVNDESCASWVYSRGVDHVDPKSLRIRMKHLTSEAILRGIIDLGDASIPATDDEGSGKSRSGSE